MEIFDLLQEKLSNDACLGYALKALKALGYSENEIEKILNEMEKQFDFLSTEEAAELYKGLINP